MTSSQSSGFMTHIRRALFQDDEDEEKENLTTTQDFHDIVTTNKPKSRRGQRQKWNQSGSSSVLVGIDDNTSVLVQTTTAMTSRAQNPAPESGGGLLALFGGSDMKMEAKGSRQIEEKKSYAGGLLGAVGIDKPATKSRRGINAKTVGGKARGTRAKKRVSWATESSLVQATTFSTQETVDERKTRPQSNARGTHSLESSGGWPMTNMYSDIRTNAPSRRKKSDSKPFSIMPQDETPIKRKNGRVKHSESTCDKNDGDDTFMISEDSPETMVGESCPGSATKPSKRMDSRQTPEKLEVDDFPSADDMSESSPFSNDESAGHVGDTITEEPMVPSSPCLPGSRVLEVEYIPPPSAFSRQPATVDMLEMATQRLSIAEPAQDEPPPPPSPAAVDIPDVEAQNMPLSDVSTQEASPSTVVPEPEKRRSRRRPIPTDRFTPSVATKKAPAAKTTQAPPSQHTQDAYSPIQTSPPSPIPMDSDEKAEDDEPVPMRRSERAQIPTNRFTPSTKPEKPPSKGKNNKGGKQRAVKPILKKKSDIGRPPRGQTQGTAESHQDEELLASEEAMDTIKSHNSDDDFSDDETESQSLSRNEWTESQLDQLKHAHTEVDPTSSTFWSDIADRVDGRSAQECRDKWFSLVKTPAPRARKPRKDDKTNPPFAAGAAFPPDNDEDDIFNSTPLRGVFFPTANAKSMEEFEEELDDDFDVGSPVVMSARRNKRVSTEYDDGNEQTQAFQAQKVGYKSYMMGLKRGVARAIKEDKKKSKKATVARDGAKTFTESVGNGDVALKGQLTPGGTLQVKNLTQEEDDFLDYLSDPSDDEE